MQFNHSCDGGNLDLVMIKCGSPHNPWGNDGPPGALLRAKRRIEIGEELTWNYNLLNGMGQPFSSVDTTADGRVQCQCGAANCRKFWFDK